MNNMARPNQAYQHQNTGQAYQHQNTGQAYQHQNTGQAYQHQNTGQAYQHQNTGQAYQHQNTGYTNQYDNNNNQDQYLNTVANFMGGTYGQGSGNTSPRVRIFDANFYLEILGFKFLYRMTKKNRSRSIIVRIRQGLGIFLVGFGEKNW
jgi:hypothetical protein